MEDTRAAVDTLSVSPKESIEVTLVSVAKCALTQIHPLISARTLLRVFKGRKGSERVTVDEGYYRYPFCINCYAFVFFFLRVSNEWTACWQRVIRDLFVKKDCSPFCAFFFYRRDEGKLNFIARRTNIWKTTSLSIFSPKNSRCSWYWFRV